MCGSVSGTRPQLLSLVASAEWARLVSPKMLSRMGEETGVLGGVPVPIILGCVDLLAGAGGHVLARSNAGAVARGVAGLDFNLPAFRSAGGGSSSGFAFEEKGGAVSHLGDGGEESPVPDCGGDEVASRVEQRREIEELVTPVIQVAAGRAVADALAVHVEDKTVVGADADRVRGRDGVQRKGAAEMQDEGFAQWRGRMSDPGGVPIAVERVGRGLLGGEGAGGRGKHQGNDQ